MSVGRDYRKKREWGTKRTGRKAQVRGISEETVETRGGTKEKRVGTTLKIIGRRTTFERYGKEGKGSVGKTSQVAEWRKL